MILARGVFANLQLLLLIVVLFFLVNYHHAVIRDLTLVVTDAESIDFCNMLIPDPQIGRGTFPVD